MESYPYPVKED